MEMVLVDWTRMGMNRCLAGVVADGAGYRTVRPLLARNRQKKFRNFGWAAHLLQRRSRWEVFQLVGWEPAQPEPPHLEDGWVKTLRPLGRSATAAQRRAILEATMAKPGEPLFGAQLQSTRAAAFVAASAGTRSLVTIRVPANQIAVSGTWRGHHADLRVELPVPDLGRRWLPIKDDPLLQRTQPADLQDLSGHIAALTAAVRAMGDTVAVRLGLSRAFESADAKSAPVCWLMADGFFSLADPQP